MVVDGLPSLSIKKASKMALTLDQCKYSSFCRGSPQELGSDNNVRIKLDHMKGFWNLKQTKRRFPTQKQDKIIYHETSQAMIQDRDRNNYGIQGT